MKDNIYKVISDPSVLFENYIGGKIRPDKFESMIRSLYYFLRKIHTGKGTDEIHFRTYLTLDKLRNRDEMRTIANDSFPAFIYYSAGVKYETENCVLESYTPELNDLLWIPPYSKFIEEILSHINQDSVIIENPRFSLLKELVGILRKEKFKSNEITPIIMDNKVPSGLNINSASDILISDEYKSSIETMQKGLAELYNWCFTTHKFYGIGTIGTGIEFNRKQMRRLAQPDPKFYIYFSAAYWKELKESGRNPELEMEYLTYPKYKDFIKEIIKHLDKNKVYLNREAFPEFNMFRDAVYNEYRKSE